MRGQHDPAFRLATRGYAGDEIFPVGQDGLSAKFDPFRPSQVLEKSGDPFLSGQVGPIFKKGRIDTWTGDKFSEKSLD